MIPIASTNDPRPSRQAHLAAGPSLDRAAAPNPKLGYVAGLFTVANWSTISSSSNFALRLAAPVPGGESNVLPFSGAGPARLREERVEMIAVPPGEYHVDAWLALPDRYPAAPPTMRKLLPNAHAFAKHFVVTAGHVVVVGRFEGNMVDKTFLRNVAAQAG